jgi:hypothetical protein
MKTKEEVTRISIDPKNLTAEQRAFLEKLSLMNKEESKVNKILSSIISFLILGTGFVFINLVQESLFKTIVFSIVWVLCYLGNRAFFSSVKKLTIHSLREKALVTILEHFKSQLEKLSPLVEDLQATNKRLEDEVVYLRSGDPVEKKG